MSKRVLRKHCRQYQNAINGVNSGPIIPQCEHCMYDPEKDVHACMMRQIVKSKPASGFVPCYLKIGEE